jgi:hypothetical protein
MSTVEFVSKDSIIKSVCVVCSAQPTSGVFFTLCKYKSGNNKRNNKRGKGNAPIYR